MGDTGWCGTMSSGTQCCWTVIRIGFVAEYNPRRWRLLWWRCWSSKIQKFWRKLKLERLSKIRGHGSHTIKYERGVMTMHFCNRNILWHEIFWLFVLIWESRERMKLVFIICVGWVFCALIQASFWKKYVVDLLHTSKHELWHPICC